MVGGIKGSFAKSDEPRLKERGQSKTYCCYYPYYQYWVGALVVEGAMRADVQSEFEEFLFFNINI